MFTTFLVVTSLFAQAAPEEASPMQLMIDVVASETTDPQLRLKHALALVQDPQAHRALIDLLTQSTDISTRTIICQALVQTNGHGDLLKPNLPKIFIEPLLSTLFDENKSLSQQAAAAMAQCSPEHVRSRLQQVLDDPEQPVSHRRAVIEVLPQLPGKQTVLILAKSLQDSEQNIRNSAWAALNELMPIPSGMTPDEFLAGFLPELKKMNEADFMFRQYRHLHTRLQQMKLRVNQTQQQATAWRQEYLNAKTNEFVKITDPAQRLELVSKSLTNGADPALRIQALKWINDWLAGGSVPFAPIGAPLAQLLSGHISDPNAQVRCLCAGSLEKMPAFSVETAGALLEQLKKEPDPAAQINQLDALGALKYAPAADTAILLLQGDNPRLNAASARALGDIASAQTDSLDVNIETIIKALVDKSIQPKNPPALRLQLVTALGKIATLTNLRPQAMAADQTLRQALDDDNADVRTQAVRALRHLHSAAVMPLLIDGRNMLNDPDEAVRFAVLEAVNQYGNRSHLKPLQERLAGEVSNEALAREIRNSFNLIFSTLTVSECFEELNVLRQAAQPDQPLLDLCTQTLLDKIKQTLQNDASGDPSRLQLLQLALLTENSGVIEAMAVQMPVLAASPSGEQALNSLAVKIDSFDLVQINQLRRAINLVNALITPLEKYPSESLRKQWDRRRTDLAVTLVNNLLAMLKPDNGKIDPADIDLLNQLQKYTLKIAPDASPEQQRLALEEYRDKLLNKSNTTTAPEKPLTPPPGAIAPKPNSSSPTNPSEAKPEPIPVE
ncbi:MAG: HEAT repeat domain-containing protein [Sedimentisphaerales bacterium]|nr:HEAT repeat domain-containing protein [Sedimentisphaerales bacterium]